MVLVGFTLTEIVGAVPLKTVPSDNVPEMVPAPVTAIDNVALPPLQIDGVPLKAPVGRGSTVIIADPVLSAAIDEQVPFVRSAIV